MQTFDFFILMQHGWKPEEQREGQLLGQEGPIPGARKIGEGLSFVSHA